MTHRRQELPIDAWAQSYEHTEIEELDDTAAMMRVVRAMLIGATIGLLCFGAWWAADKTLHGVETYQGEARG